jgi:hypothetical protein
LTLPAWKVREARLLEAGLCAICGKEPLWREGARNCLTCLKKRRERNTRYQRVNRYKVTPEAFQQLEEEQNGQCAICKLPPPEGEQLALDHDHNTGDVRGLLCRKHNLALGQFGDDPLLLRAAADYLEGGGSNGI